MTGGTTQDQFIEQFPTLVLHRRMQHNVVPQSGDVLVFSSYFRHAVFPDRGGGERISVAFNARLTVE